MAGGTVSTILSEWLVVFLISFSLIFEALLHRLEHWMNRKHQHLQSVARVLYRELMVLGFVSFTFIIYQFIKKPEKDIVLSFEFAHVFIFLLAVFHTIVVLSTMFTSLHLSSRWKEMERLDLVKYLHLKEEYTRLRLRMHRHSGPMWRQFRWWFPNFATLIHYRNLHEVMTFHDIRFQFIFYRNLPEHFRFSSFLRKIKSLAFIELVESHWTLYAFFLIVVLLDIVRRYRTGDDEQKTDTVESAFIIAASILLAISVQVLAHKIRKVYWELTKHPRVYYEGVEPSAVAEELAAAEHRLEADRAQRRMSRSGNASEDPGVVGDDEATDTNAAIDDLPETELTEPMSHTPVRKSLILAGSPDPSKASPLVSHPLPEEMVSETRLSMSRFAANGSRGPGSYGGSGAMLSASGGSSGLGQSIPENKYISHPDNFSVQFAHHRRSTEQALIDRPDTHASNASINKRSRSSMSDHPASRSTPPESGAHPHFQDIAARHSLEISRHTVTAPKRILDPSSQASVALAAVAAARKRSTEYQGRRGSLDNGANPELRYIGSPRIMSRLSSRGVSTEDDVRTSVGDKYRGSLDGWARRGGRSIELAAALPRDEMVERHKHQHPLGAERDLEAGMPSERSKGKEGPTGNQGTMPEGQVKKLRFGLPGRGEKSVEDGGERSVEDAGESKDSRAATAMNSFIRSKSLGFMNATILKNLEQQRKAQTMEPAQYPWLVKKLIPRLGRVASPVEKLFWFGSHKLFMWCVEFTLYFSTVLTAAATAGLALLLLSAEAKTITTLNIVSFVLPPITLLFVLFRIAGIIKKYIFILHNASLVPEALAIEAIHKVSRKEREDSRDDLSGMSGSETEREDEDTARERRRNLGRFFRSEAEVGNIPGIEPVGDSSNTGSEAVASRRLKKRKLSLRLRKRRIRAQGEVIASTPSDTAK